MSKIVSRGVVLGGAAAVAAALAAVGPSAGIAGAEDGVVGQTYRDARAALSSQGLSVIIATTVGDQLDRDECMVTSANRSTGVNGFGGTAANAMMLNLNCNAKLATRLWPGYSRQNPIGRAAHESNVEAEEARAAREAGAGDAAEAAEAQ